MVGFRSFNPDVLSCLANLSNDEVFTPPRLANEILDLLPQSLWTNKNATFLDPCSKTGVFLREIAKRLLAGLEQEIPDLHDRINHIFKNQIFGIAITELTAHLSRRSVYCSKHAMGKYSVCEVFDNDAGNIRFERTDHRWKDSASTEGSRCVFCGANKENYDRGVELESHAYEFIHTNKPEELFNMKFDVIVGNPPYQMSDGGGMGTSAIPLYHKFIQQAKKLSPRYLSMIVPARWYSGGKGLDEFRDEMLHDERIREIHDFPDATDVFPGVQIKGGVCYFLWDRDNKGFCKVSSHNHNMKSEISTMVRPLLERNAETFIRFNEAISIVQKVKIFNEPPFELNISTRKPFGIDSNFTDFSPRMTKDKNIKLYRFGDVGYITKKQINKNIEWVEKIKVIISKAGSGSDSFPHQILNVPIIAEVNSACTETYIVLSVFDDEKKARNLTSYVATRFFRFLVLINKPTQNATSKVYAFVPMQDFSEPWTDEKLYAKYGITAEEQAFIKSMIRPMEV